MVFRASGVRMPPIRLADIERKLEIERCSLARHEAETLRHQEQFKETQKFWVGLCDRERKAIQELEDQLIVARKELEQGEEWSDEELTHNWEAGLASHELFEDVNKARKVQFAYITTGSGAGLASILALLSGKVAAGVYKNPGECPGWNISSKSSYTPEEATAVQEYATPNTNATIEAEVAPQDEAILDDSISELIEYPGELSPTILAQNARASRIAIRQGKAARGSAAGSSRIHSERIQYLNKLPPSNNAQDSVENASSVSGIRGKAARRSAAGSSMVLSEHNEFLDELPPSTNTQDTNETASSMCGDREMAARRFAAAESAAGSSMVHSERDESLNELQPSISAQERFKNPFILSYLAKLRARGSATETSGMRSKLPFRGISYAIAPPDSNYKGGPRVIKVMHPEGEDDSMIELPRPTIQNVAIQTLYPQLFKLETGCDETIKRIFEMPETRQLDLAKDHAFSLDDLTYGYEPHRLEAALGQIRGVVARKPCAHCKSKTSKGPFATCVVVPGECFGACCNCIYEMPLNSNKCTLFEHTIGHRNAEAKAKNPLRAASIALRSYFPKLRSIKSLLTEGLKEADTQSAAAMQRQNERVWAAYPRGF